MRDGTLVRVYMADGTVIIRRIVVYESGDGRSRPFISLYGEIASTSNNLVDAETDMMIPWVNILCIERARSGVK